MSLSKRPRQKPKRSQTTRLWLIRHAEVESRYRHTFGGRINMNLSPRGREQAGKLAEYLQDKTF